MKFNFNSFITQKMFAAVIRHLLTGVGVVLVDKGYTTNDQLTEVLPGLAMMLAGIVWSFYQKIEQEKHVQTALEMPKGTSRETLAEKVK